jgi:hypothetical protein
MGSLVRDLLPRIPQFAVQPALMVAGASSFNPKSAIEDGFPTISRNFSLSTKRMDGKRLTRKVEGSLVFARLSQVPRRPTASESATT